MSTSATPPASPQSPPAPAAKDSTPNELVVISHSSLMYWWPVWACGFIMAILTAIDGSLMAVVPPGTIADKQHVKVETGKADVEREILIVPEGKKLPRAADGSNAPKAPHLHVAQNQSYGVIFFTVLLLVVFITNVPLRGMWSFFIIILVILISLILHLAQVWHSIVEKLSYLDVRINMGGYLFISIILFTLWILTVTVFDRRIYIIFTPGQFRVCTEIGGGEKVFDTMGMKLEKQQSDFFRHTVLGLGAGDLIVKTSGATNEHFDMHNVLWINSKIQQIEDMLHKKKVVETK
jgi:hypothetical protein